MHMLILSHVDEKEIDEGALAGASGHVFQPLIPGKTFRKQLPGVCDLTFHGNIDDKVELVDGHNDPEKPRYYMQWIPDPKRPTKSRMGALSEQARLSNEWDVLKPLIERALERREDG